MAIVFLKLVVELLKHCFNDDGGNVLIWFRIGCSIYFKVGYSCCNRWKCFLLYYFSLRAPDRWLMWKVMVQNYSHDRNRQEKCSWSHISTTIINVTNLCTNYYANFFVVQLIFFDNHFINIGWVHWSEAFLTSGLFKNQKSLFSIKALSRVTSIISILNSALV